jgi:hypothetical protein
MVPIQEGVLAAPWTYIGPDWGPAGPPGRFDPVMAVSEDSFPAVFEHDHGIRSIEILHYVLDKVLIEIRTVHLERRLH